MKTAEIFNLVRVHVKPYDLGDDGKVEEAMLWLSSEVQQLQVEKKELLKALQQIRDYSEPSIFKCNDHTYNMIVGMRGVAIFAIQKHQDSTQQG